MLPCPGLAWLAFLCDPQFPWDEVLVGAVAGALVGLLVRAPRAFLAIFNPRYYKLYGRWYRYAVGFFPNDAGEIPIHRGIVRIYPRPLLSPGLVSRDPRTFSYTGRTVLEGGLLYVYWSGQGHAEQMLSVYREPLTVDARTRLIGVKACITRDGLPAANVDILSRSRMTDAELAALMARPGLLAAFEGPCHRIVVRRPIVD